MHELGIIYKIAERVMEAVEENQLSEVEAIVLTVGENTGIVPSYLHACYPAAVDGTLLEKTILEIKEVTANGVCDECAQVFAIFKNESKCPHCSNITFDVISGDEFMIKEIRAR